MCCVEVPVCCVKLSLWRPHVYTHTLTHLLAPDREFMIGQSTNYIKVRLVEPVSLLDLLSGVGVKGCLQENGGFESICTTESPPSMGDGLEMLDPGAVSAGLSGSSADWRIFFRQSFRSESTLLAVVCCFCDTGEVFLNLASESFNPYTVIQNHDLLYQLSFLLLWPKYPTLCKLKENLFWLRVERYSAWW